MVNPEECIVSNFRQGLDQILAGFFVLINKRIDKRISLFFSF